VHLVSKELAIYSDDAATRRRKLITIPVDVLREHLLTPASLKSNLGGAKVLIVDEAELIDRSGQNLLLKTLEEPPAGTYLILITSREDQLLPTVRSRCQRVGFHLLEDDDVQRWLSEHRQISGDRLPWIVRFARGSIGRAAIAVDYELDDWLRTVEPMLDDMISRRRAPDLGKTLSSFADEFAKKWVDDPDHPNASKEAANKLAMRLLMSMLGDVCRDRLNRAVQRVPAGRADEAEDAGRPWLVGIDCLRDAEQQMGSNVAMPLLLENLAVQWAARILG
jgi:DNA polymerase-3 subunit delta'